MLCFYHPLFSSTPLLVPRHFPKSVFLCGFFSKLFAYFHLSSCNFDQLCRFCMLPQSCKQLHTTYSNAELSSCFDGQLKAQPVQSVVRIKISLSSSSFKTDPECSLPSSQGSWKQECPGCGPESDLGLEHIMFWHDQFLTWHDSFKTGEISKWPLKQLFICFYVFGHHDCLPRVQKLCSAGDTACAKCLLLG